jgi:hypothetical protein
MAFGEIIGLTYKVVRPFGHMLRFLAGVATGWVAARALPPSDAHPLSMPTIEEIEVLTKKFKHLMNSLQQKLNEKEEKSA